MQNRLELAMGAIKAGIERGDTDKEGLENALSILETVLDGTHMVDVPALIATVRELQERITKLEAVVEEFDDIISESEGVYGLHLNGDGAEWNWLMGNKWLEKYSEMEASK